MADSMTFRMEGMDELRRALGRIAEATKGVVLTEGLEAASEPIMEYMRSHAPIGKTGLLSDSVARETVEQKDTVSEVHVGVLKRAFYAGFPELGTRFQGAQPFMRPAFDSQAGAATAAFAGHVRKRVESASG